MSEPTMASIKAAIEKWGPIAADVPEAEATTPVTVLTGEALDLAHFVTQRWEPVEGKKPLPGMRAALASGAINETIAQDMLELALAVGHAHAQFRAVSAGTLEAPVERGEFLLTELKRCLEFILDDGVTDEQDADLARLSESHSDMSTHDSLATSVEGFALYADKYRDRLGELPEFDPGFIDEALVVARRLREQSAIKLSNAQITRQSEQLTIRNRMITLLVDRMHRVRRAARFVFRNHPDIARLTGSDYERRRRARNRAEKAAQEVAPESASN